MTLRASGVVLGAAIGSIGCLIPRPLTTRTDVVTAADSKPFFGPKAELRALDQTTVMAWDTSLGSYTGGADGLRTLRVARFKGDVHLFQAELQMEDEGYTLVLARVSKGGDVIPLVCDIPQASAADYGVRITTPNELGLALRGDRAGIIGLLASVLPTCKPLMRFAHWTPLAGELAAAGAEPGAGGPAGCRTCPDGGCVQGAVADRSGAILPGATVRVEPRSGSGSVRAAESDEEGEFLVTGLAAGTYVVVIELSGFRNVGSQPAFTVTPSVTYLFESPFELSVGSYDESITMSLEPIPCRKGPPQSKR